MTTEVLKTDINNPDKQTIERAAAILRGGGLVGIPTETVYGLAADALDAAAVKKIFEAKGRPQDNPLIIHIAEPDWLERYAVEVPSAAYALANAFWPGPMTLILQRAPVVPAVVSAGMETVAIRFPSHPVARAIIRAAGVPLAAPSANRSGIPSPTTAAHVLHDLDGRIDAVVDGGDCAVGVESTVVALHDGVPHVLRPGGITPAQLQSVLGSVEIDYAVTHRLAPGVRVSSPGMKYKHYAPKADVSILDGTLFEAVEYVRRNAPKTGCAVLCFAGEEPAFGGVPTVVYGAADDDVSQAQGLFGALRRLDEMGAATAFARCPRKSGVGLAVYNRLLRAAAFQEITLGCPAGGVAEETEREL